VLATIVTLGRHVRHQKRHSDHDDIPAQCRGVHEASQKDEKPLARTINGGAKALAQVAEAYRRPLDIAAQTDAHEGIRQGREDLKKGRLRPGTQSAGHVLSSSGNTSLV
jgi:hypothetical protein